jgi:hypothetical protein
MLLPFVPQSLSVLAFTTVSQVNQNCFSLRDNKDVITVVRGSEAEKTPALLSASA